MQGSGVGLPTLLLTQDECPLQDKFLATPVESKVRGGNKMGGEWREILRKSAHVNDSTVHRSAASSERIGLIT